MTHRERQLAAIRHELTDRVPVDATYIETIAAIADYLGLPNDEEAILNRLGIDGRYVTAWPYLGKMPTNQTQDISSEWGTVTGNDYGTAHWYPLADAESIAEVEAYPWWPDPARYDFQNVAAMAKKAVEQYAVRGPYWKPLFCQVCELMGMEEAMIKMSVAPAVFEAALERVFQHVYVYSRHLLDACDNALDIYCLGDDFATQRGLLFSPAQWRQFLKPRFSRLFSLAKERGKFVWFHSCGDITAVLPDLIEIGLDVWETVQLHTLPISPQALKREYGKDLTFFGAINTQRLPFVSSAEVKEETLQCIEVLGEGGGYICGPDHHIKPDVPAENTVTLFDTATAYRATGYTISPAH